MTRAARIFWVVAAGVLLLELAWIIALPAFRGLDEFTHVFRADSVAHGHILNPPPQPDEHGSLVPVRPGVASAARPQCEAYGYTASSECQPVERLADGRVLQASTASSYNPLWYAVVGPASRLADGAGADFVMRLVSAVSIALLVGWAAALVTRWDRTGWMLSAVLLLLTPTALYSGGVAAPNGVAYGAALLFWAAVVTLLADPDRPPLVAVMTASVLVAHTHTTGVVWLAIAAVALVLMQGPRWWIQWVATAPRSRGTAVAVMALASVAAFAWVRVAGTNTLSEADPAAAALPSPVQLLGQQLVWFFQTVGAFPERSTPAPLVVYALWLSPLLLLLVIGARQADPRARRGLVWLTGCWVVVPMVLTLISYRSLSFAWQGRYALPLVDGIVLLAAWSVTRSARVPEARVRLVVLMTTVAHAWSVVTVTRSEADRGLGYAVADHLPHTDLLVLGLTMTGGLLLLLAGQTGDPGQPEAGWGGRRQPADDTVSA